MCLAPKAPKPPPLPAPAPNFDAVKSTRKDERRRQLGAYGAGDTLLTGPKGAPGTANTGKTLLGS